MELSEGDIVLCTVKSITRTTIFVNIEDLSEERLGAIPTSEIAPGRIRNIRDYVVPNKKIACKILRIDNSGNVVLSLRRVSLKERKEIMDSYQKERTARSILKVIFSESFNDVYDKIRSSEGKKINVFFQEARENPKLLSPYTNVEQATKLLKILNDKREKEKEIKKEIVIKSKNPCGLSDIKEAFSKCKECEVTYIGGGKYNIKIKGKDYKEANNKMTKEISDIEKIAKDKNMDLTIKSK